MQVCIGASSFFYANLVFTLGVTLSLIAHALLFADHVLLSLFHVHFVL